MSLKGVISAAKVLGVQMSLNAIVRELQICLLPARRRPQGLVVIGVCLCVRTFLSARYLKNGFMDHHQIRWVGAGGEPLEQVQFW